VDFTRAYMRHRFEVFGQSGFDAFRVLPGELLVNAELPDQYRRQTLEPTFNAAEAAVRLVGHAQMLHGRWRTNTSASNDEHPGDAGGQTLMAARELP
jgi:hypothetical protein